MTLLFYSYLTTLYHLAMLITLYFQLVSLHEVSFIMHSPGTPPTVTIPLISVTVSQYPFRALLSFLKNVT